MRRAVALPSGGTVLLMDSMSSAVPEDAGALIVSASHGGTSAGEFASGIRPLFATFNDAGRGKDDAGVHGLAILQAAGLAAACCDSMSARIGEADDHWENGVLSAVNAAAAELGIRVGMSVQQAVVVADGARGRRA